MAKTESTAVNELIDLVQQGKKPQAEPAADLFGAPKSTTVQPPPRITATVPPMRGAGEVAPLPRGRAPQSTSQHGMPAIPPPVRMSTAEPPTGNTIPPISRPTRPSGQLPNPVRASSPLPAPRNTRASSIPSLPTLPPPSAPVAAPFEARPSVPQQIPIVPRPSLEENWFDVNSGKIQKLDEQTWVGTAPVPKRNDTLALVKKLIAPTIVLAIVGVMVGGFLAFDGDGGKKKKQGVAPAEQKLEMTAAPAEAAGAVAPAAVAATEPAAPSADEPVAAEPPTKEEALAKQAAAQAESAAAMTQDAPPTAAAKLDEKPAKADVKAEPAKEAAPAKDAPVAVKAVSTSGAPAPVREIRTSQGVIKQVDVRIDSKPTGATVMLVDNGKTSFLGSTPLATSLDPSRTYDVIFTYPGRPTQMAPLDPKKSSRLDVTLGRAKSRTKTTDAAPPSSKLADAFFEEPAKPEKKVAEKKAEEPKVEKKAVEPKVEKAVEPKTEKKVAEKKVAEPKGDAGQGTLMVSSKPPCEIHIDGKPTGLSTPQRSISLPAGAHKITFVNEAEGIKKTVSVSITADQTTKLIQDLMKK